MKKLLILLICINILVFTYAEKWVGKAATYQKKKGSKTASGEIYDEEVLTAACNGFRLGAEIVITSATTKKQITVIVNDRINEDMDYFILLTPKAARELEMEWQTSIVVIDADFTDVNSLEKLDVNGLISEGEIDLETLKRFPEVDLNIDKTETTEKTETDQGLTEKPELEKEEVVPIKKEKKVVLDYDEKNGFKVDEAEDEFPEKEILRDPESLSQTERLDVDLEAKKTTVVEKTEKTEITEKPVLDKELTPENKDMTFAMDQDLTIKEEKIVKETIEKTEKIEKVEWKKRLDKGYYIRFSTAFKEDEGNRRYLLFKKILPDLVGVHSKGRYILFIGPIDKSELDEKLDLIRSYGYQDAYIVNQK